MTDDDAIMIAIGLILFMGMSGAVIAIIIYFLFVE